MPSTKTRKSAEEETPLGFFEKFYAPHGNPKWKQLDARGLAQIIIDADRRRAEFQKQKAAKPPLPEKKVQASRQGPSLKNRPGPQFNPAAGGKKSPQDRASRSSLPPDLFADAPHGKRAAGSLDVLRKNPYVDALVSGLEAARPVAFRGAEAESRGFFATAAGSAGSPTPYAREKSKGSSAPVKLELDLLYPESPGRRKAEWLLKNHLPNIFMVHAHSQNNNKGEKEILDQRNSEDGKPIAPKKLAEMITQNPNYKPGMPVWLKSCLTGSGGANSFAKQLSIELGGAPVRAPDNYYHMHDRGERLVNEFVGGYTEEDHRPDFSNEGHWVDYGAQYPWPNTKKDQKGDQE